MKVLNKKGMDISLNFIILAVLALLALVIIALFFTGGLTNLFKQQSSVGSISSEKIALAKSECNLYCATNNQGAWDAPVFDEKDTDLAGKNCDALISAGVIDLNKKFVDGKCVDK